MREPYRHSRTKGSKRTDRKAANSLKMCLFTQHTDNKSDFGVWVLPSAWHDRASRVVQYSTHIDLDVLIKLLPKQTYYVVLLYIILLKTKKKRKYFQYWGGILFRFFFLYNDDVFNTTTKMISGFYSFFRFQGRDHAPRTVHKNLFI